MSNDEIAGRLVVLEVFTMTAVGLYLANASNDPEYSKATAILDFLKKSVSQSALPLQPGAQKHAEHYVASLVTILASNLRNMRGEASRTQ